MSATRHRVAAGRPEGRPSGAALHRPGQQRRTDGGPGLRGTARSTTSASTFVRQSPAAEKASILKTGSRSTSRSRKISPTSRRSPGPAATIFRNCPINPRAPLFASGSSPITGTPPQGCTGFLRAVIDTYQHIALGTLQGHLQPWRPPSFAISARVCGYQGRPSSHREHRERELHSDGRSVSRSTKTASTSSNGSTSTTTSAADMTEVMSGRTCADPCRRPRAFLIPAIVVAKPIAVEYSDFWRSIAY